MKVLELLSVLRPGSTDMVGFQMEVVCLSVQICCYWLSCPGLSIQVSEVEEQLKYVFLTDVFQTWDGFEQTCLSDVKATGRGKKGSKTK